MVDEGTGDFDTVGSGFTVTTNCDYNTIGLQLAAKLFGTMLATKERDHGYC